MKSSWSPPEDWDIVAAIPRDDRSTDSRDAGATPTSLASMLEATNSLSSTPSDSDKADLILTFSPRQITEFEVQGMNFRHSVATLVQGFTSTQVGPCGATLVDDRRPQEDAEVSDRYAPLSAPRAAATEDLWAHRPLTGPAPASIEKVHHSNRDAFMTMTATASTLNAPRRHSTSSVDHRVPRKPVPVYGVAY